MWGAVGELCVGSCGSGICVVGAVGGMSVGEGELCEGCACGGNCLPSV